VCHLEVLLGSGKHLPAPLRALRGRLLSQIPGAHTRAQRVCRSSIVHKQNKHYSSRRKQPVSVRAGRLRKKNELRFKASCMPCPHKGECTAKRPVQVQGKRCENVPRHALVDSPAHGLVALLVRRQGPVKVPDGAYNGLHQRLIAHLCQMGSQRATTGENRIDIEEKTLRVVLHILPLLYKVRCSCLRASAFTSLLIR